MKIKNNLNDSLEQKNSIYLKYKSSKIIFLFTTFIFFVDFYLVGAGFHKNLLERILSPLYILFLISINLFIFFGTQKLFFEKKVISYIISLIFILLSIFFILPVIL